MEENLKGDVESVSPIAQTAPTDAASFHAGAAPDEHCLGGVSHDTSNSDAPPLVDEAVPPVLASRLTPGDIGRHPRAADDAKERPIEIGKGNQ